MITGNVLQTIGIAISFSGTLVIISGTIGIARFPDFYSRLHPAGVSDAFGVPIVLIGTAVQNPCKAVCLKVALIILFTWITGSTSAHALSQAAYKTESGATLNHRKRGNK